MACVKNLCHGCNTLMLKKRLNCEACWELNREVDEISRVCGWPSADPVLELERYCSKECQKKMWRYHKPDCGLTLRKKPDVQAFLVQGRFRMAQVLHQQQCIKAARRQYKKVKAKKRELDSLVEELNEGINAQDPRCQWNGNVEQPKIEIPKGTSWESLVSIFDKLTVDPQVHAELDSLKPSLTRPLDVVTVNRPPDDRAIDLLLFNR